MNDDIAVVKGFLGVYRRRLIAAAVGRRLLTALCVLFTAWTILQVCFAVFPWTGLIAAWTIGVAACLLAAAAIVIDGALIRAPSLRGAADTAECQARRPHGLLAVALEMAQPTTAGSSLLKAEAVRRARESLPAYPRRPPRRLQRGYLWWLAVSVGAVGVVSSVLTPAIYSFWDAPFSAAQTLGAAIAPGTVRVPRLAAVTLRCTPRQRQFPLCELTTTSLDGSGISRSLVRADSAGSFSARFDSLRASFVYAFTIGAHVYGPDTVFVVPAPTLYELHVTIDPPAYTSAPRRVLPLGQGSFAAYAGSKAAFSVASPAPLKKAWLIRRPADSTGMIVDKGKGACAITITDSCSYSFGMIDSLGQANDSLPLFRADLIADGPPVVTFLKPGANKRLEPQQLETLWVEGADDIGVRNLSLHWRTSGDRPTGAGARDVSPATPQKVVRREIVWNLKDLSLYPGDTVYYWAAARDNKPFGPPQTAVTDTFWFRVPSFAEIHEEVLNGEAGAQRSLATVKEEQGRLRERLSQIIRSARDGKNLSWEEKEIVKDLAQRAEAQKDSLARAVQSLRETVQRLQKQGLSNETILRKMDEVRTALEDLVRAYGDSLLFEPPKPDQTVSWQDMKQALEKMGAMLPDLEKRLDNTLKYLEQLRRDQALASLAARARKLAEEQKTVAASGDDERQALPRQKDIAANQDDLVKDIEAGADARGGQPLVSPGDLPSLNRVNALRQAMKQSLEQGSLPSRPQMNEMSAALLSLSEDLQSQLSGAMAARMEREKELLLGLAHDALSLAQWQEQTRQTARAAPRGGDRRIQERLIAEQQALRQALGRSRARLDSLSAIPPDKLQGLAKDYAAAAASLDRAVGAAARPGGEEEMAGCESKLNGVAQDLLKTVSEMPGMQGRSGQGMGGMMAGLRRISGQQAAVNAATGDLLRSMLEGRSKGSGEGGESSSDAAARSSAEAAQQAIADQLRKLADEYGKRAGGDMEKRVGDLEQEARRLADQLQSPTPDVKDRQDRFLVRMLQTALSLHKQDEGSEERKSTSATTIYTQDLTIDPRALSRATDAFFRLRERAFQGNIPEEYRLSVRAYFDSLGALFLK